MTEKAIDYSVRAGRAAASVFAFTDAMMHWQAALELMEQHGCGSATARRVVGYASGISLSMSIVKPR